MEVQYRGGILLVEGMDVVVNLMLDLINVISPNPALCNLVGTALNR